MGVGDERISVLVIEDDEVFKDFLYTFLKNKRMDISLASDGAEGLEKVEKKHFDLIITDLKMPKMGGMDFLKNLRSMGNNDAAVIILTAYGEIDSYIVDPFVKTKNHLVFSGSYNLPLS